MDYAAIIREAWALTRRYRFLWVLGFFSGTSLGSCGGNINLPSRSSGADRDVAFGRDTDAGDAFDRVGEAWGDLGGWVADHPGVVLTAALIFFALSLVFVAISLIAQGGMARATVDLAEGRTTSLGAA